MKQGDERASKGMRGQGKKKGMTLGARLQGTGTCLLRTGARIYTFSAFLSGKGK